VPFVDLTDARNAPAPWNDRNAANKPFLSWGINNSASLARQISEMNRNGMQLPICPLN
jgi:hypothetical protein